MLENNMFSPLHLLSKMQRSKETFILLVSYIICIYVFIAMADNNRGYLYRMNLDTYSDLTYKTSYVYILTIKYNVYIYNMHFVEHIICIIDFIFAIYQLLTLMWYPCQFHGCLHLIGMNLVRTG